MKLHLAALVACVALAGFNVSPASAEGTTMRAPSISVEQAIQLARAHLKAHKVSTSRHYIDSIKLNLVTRGDRGSCWIITWELNAFAKGGQIIVRVFMNKAVEVGYGE
jgi:hypothetical protein